MKIRVRNSIFLDIAIAIMICVYPFRRLIIMTNLTGHPALLIAIIAYSMLLLYFATNGVRIRQLIKMALPVIIVSFLLLMTWIAFPERHSFYLNSLYSLWDILFPTSCIYLLSISLLEKRITDFYPVFKMSGYIIFFYCMIASIDVLTDGIWTRESIYNGEIITIESNYYLDWGYWLYLACVIFTGLYIKEKRIKYPVMICISLLWILLFGSRGALLCYIIFASIIYIFNSARKGLKRGIIVGTIVVLCSVLIGYGVLQNWILSMTKTLNIQSRTLEKLLNGTIIDDSNRIFIYLTLFSKFFESPIFGIGIYGDRYYMNYLIQGGSAYSHNVILEMLISFGLSGLLFIIWFVFALILSIAKCRNKEKRIIYLICAGGCLPLLWSLTFWSHPMFWVTIAILCNFREPHHFKYAA